MDRFHKTVSLLDLFIEGQSSKTDKEGYSEFYECIFSKLRTKHMNILEIGLGSSECSSLKIWSKYFLNSSIFGLEMDHDIVSSAVDIPRCTVFFGNQEKREDLLNIVNEAKSFDIIIDDGSHTAKGQQISLGYLFQFLVPGGIYIIEDLDCNRERQNHVSKRRRRQVRTIWFIKDFQEFKYVESENEYMTHKEIDYFEQHAELCELFCSEQIALIRKAE